MLNILDEFTRECLAIVVRRKLNSVDVLDTLTDLFILRGIPGYIRSDNGVVIRKPGRWIAHPRRRCVMPTPLTQLRRFEMALEQANGLLGELKARAIILEDFETQMVLLETTNPDLEILSDARINPSDDGHLIEEALTEVRREIDELNRAAKQ